MKSYFSECSTLEQAKQTYYKWAKVLHPDAGGTDAEFVELGAQYDYFCKNGFARPEAGGPAKGRPAEDFHPETMPEAFRQAVAAVVPLVGVDLEVCGRWLWATGNTYPNREALKAAGYRFSRSKVAWYWHAEEDASRSRKRYTLEEIRERHGSQTISGRPVTCIA